MTTFASRVRTGSGCDLAVGGTPRRWNGTCNPWGKEKYVLGFLAKCGPQPLERLDDFAAAAPPAGVGAVPMSPDDALGDPHEVTREAILTRLRRGPATADDLARALRLTRTAIRAQLARLERDGAVTRGAVHRGPTKPSQVYRLTAAAELRMSRLYVPMLTQLLHVLSRRLGAAEFDALLREVGRELLDGRPRPSGPLRARVDAASALFNEFGGLTTVEETDDALLIRSHGCPLAATTARHPEACNAVESLFREFIGAPVDNCCDRDAQLRCCFEVRPGAGDRPPREAAAS
jgi:predicted ArsR family transcriptional regulator